jgi:hypothetical protein
MKRLGIMIAALSLTGAAPAASPLDGVWVADLSSQSGLPRDVYVVANGTYACESCAPPRSYPADGRPRPVPGDPDVTSESVTVAGPRSIVTRIAGRALTRTTTMTVAPDGETATYVSIDHRPGVKGPLRTEYVARRVAAGPPGSHPVSGTWQGIRYVSVPEQVRTTELHAKGNQLTYRVPLGYTYTATFGGDFVPLRGPYDGTILVAVERVNERQIVETRKQDGRMIMRRSFTVLPDGRTMEIASTDPATDVTFRITARRK